MTAIERWETEGGAMRREATPPASDRVVPGSKKAVPRLAAPLRRDPHDAPGGLGPAAAPPSLARATATGAPRNTRRRTVSRPEQGRR